MSVIQRLLFASLFHPFHKTPGEFVNPARIPGENCLPGQQVLANAKHIGSGLDIFGGGMLCHAT
jgi:hypothetical protein